MLSLENSLLHTLHRAFQAVESNASARLNAIDITLRQALVLMAIEELGEANQTALTKATGVDRSTMAEMLRRMARTGIIQRPRSKIDTRSRLVSLTPAGRAVAAEARAVLSLAEIEARVAIGRPARMTFIGLQRLAYLAEFDAKRKTGAVS